MAEMEPQVSEKLVEVSLVTEARRVPFLRRLVLIAAGVLPVACCLFPIAGRAQIASDTILHAQMKIQTKDNRDAQCKIVFLGIVGGLETSNYSRSGVVQIRDILRGQAYPEVCAKSFSPYDWPSGLHWVLKHFPSRPGQLTKEDLESAPKVIIVGHSLGGWAAISVARNLNRKNIPVELSVQIDSVGITDYTVPRNVKAAAIFHARDILMFMTTKKIRMEDPSQTRLVENVLVRGAGHESVTRDPRIREIVIATVESLRVAVAMQNHHTELPQFTHADDVPAF